MINRIPPVNITSTADTQESMNPYQKKVDSQFKDVGALYEKQFLREMMKQMRATVPEGGLIQQSMGEKIFQEQLDQQYVEKWGDQGGIGLGNLIYKSLLDRFGEQMGLRPMHIKSTGPLPITQAANFDGKVISGNEQKGEVTFQFSRKVSVEKKSNDLVSPFKGTIKNKFNLANGQTLVELSHGENLRSQILFNGTLRPEIDKGFSVETGEKIGILNPDSNLLIWRVKSL